MGRSVDDPTVDARIEEEFEGCTNTQAYVHAFARIVTPFADGGGSDSVYTHNYFSGNTQRSELFDLLILMIIESAAEATAASRTTVRMLDVGGGPGAIVDHCFTHVRRLGYAQRFVVDLVEPVEEYVQVAWADGRRGARALSV